MNRFIKIDADGEPLPDQAVDWEAVLDTATGLTWSAGALSDHSIQGETFETAQKSVSGLWLTGHNDWRLPTVEELFLLVNRSLPNPAPGSGLFPYRSYKCWSGTRQTSQLGWAVDLMSGEVSLAFNCRILHVHPVRGGPAFRPDNGDEQMIKICSEGQYLPQDSNRFCAVAHKGTGLMWSAADIVDGGATYEESALAAQALRLAGYSDWRLPTLDELFMLADREKRYDPAINVKFFFPCTLQESSIYWSSTRVALCPSEMVWGVPFVAGTCYALDINKSYSARAVRKASATELATWICDRAGG